MNKFIRIQSNHFVAGLSLDKDLVCYEAAPILNYMVGWDIKKIWKYCKQKNWEINDVRRAG